MSAGGVDAGLVEGVRAILWVATVMVLPVVRVVGHLYCGVRR